jgi:hypothetical protein
MEQKRHPQLRADVNADPNSPPIGTAPYDRRIFEAILIQAQ